MKLEKEQLRMTDSELADIGFFNYRIYTSNGYFLYNSIEVTWKYISFTRGVWVSITLDITNRPTLYTVLSAFGVDFNLII